MTLDLPLKSNIIGCGSFGEVHDLGNGYVIKNMKSENDCSLDCYKIRELTANQQLSKYNFKHILVGNKFKIKENGNLLIEMKNGGTILSSALSGNHNINEISYVLLKAMSEIYLSSRFIHRDLKLNNIVWDGSNPQTIKIIDWGSSRRLNEGNSNNYSLNSFTSKICTGCFRPPEAHLGIKNYNDTFDVFSMGIILLYLINKDILFYSTCSSINFIKKAKLLGITNSEYEFMKKNAPKWNTFKNFLKVKPSSKDISFGNSYLSDLIKKMLNFDYTRRITFKGILNHPFMIMNGCYGKPKIRILKNIKVNHYLKKRFMNIENWLEDINNEECDSEESLKSAIKLFYLYVSSADKLSGSLKLYAGAALLISTKYNDFDPNICRHGIVSYALDDFTTKELLETMCDMLNMFPNQTIFEDINIIF